VLSAWRGSRWWARNEGSVVGSTEIKAIAFDLDGTLVESHIDFVRMKGAVIAYLASQGIEGDFTPRQTNVEILTRAEGIYRRRGGLDGGWEKIADKIGQIMDAVEMDSVSLAVPIDGSRETLAFMRQVGIGNGVVTRSCRAYALAVMERCGLSELVDVAVARDDVSKPKPDPEQLFLLAKLLGVDASEIVVVGDTLMDFQFAKNAGVGFVGVLTGFATEDAFRSAGCHVILNSVAELPKALGIC
jgi:phosphoglycolate phosphatase